jgi:trehalose 6-phosphate phosphatase
MRRPCAPEQLDVARVLAARRGRGLVAVFDVDGTLAPIAPTPGDAHVPPPTRRALGRLARRRDTLVGIVSGRPIAQVARLVGPGFWIAGLHGAVRRAPGGRVVRLWSDEVARTGALLARTLAASLRDVRGVVVEPKGPVVAVHVRAASPAGRARARNVVARSRPDRWTLLEGRRVLELRPDGLPGKGDAVQWIAAARPGAAILYAGDDATDEDAFRALRRDDFPVRVGGAVAHRERGRAGPGTAALFTLPDTTAVGGLVAALAEMAPAPLPPLPMRGRRRHNRGNRSTSSGGVA